MDTKSPNELDQAFNVEEAEKAEKKAKEPVAPLTKEEEDRIVEAWNIKKFKTLKEIVEYAIGPGFDGRHGRGLLVKKFLASKNAKARPSNIKEDKSYTLTDNDKEFITNNAKHYTSYVLLTRELFQDEKISPLHAESKAVKAFYEALPIDAKPIKLNETDDLFRPPKMEREAITRINDYVQNALVIKDDDGKIRPKNKEELSPHQKESVVKLIKFMQTHRFTYEIGLLKKISEREEFESTFVRMCWDKPDLTEEEVELYIMYCVDVISIQRMHEEEQELLQLKRDELETSGKIPMAVVEMIGKLRGDIATSKKRQTTILHDLNGKRSERLKEIKDNQANMLSLVQAFREKKRRDQIVKIAEVHKNKVLKEKDRLETMEDLMVEVFGLSPDEIFI